MKARDRIENISSFIETAYNKKRGPATGYPETILEIIIYHKLHLCFPGPEAGRKYRKLKSGFVDWNEIRISSIREIQEIFGISSHSLEMAIFLKGLLEHVNRERHLLDLEFLADLNVTEIRAFLKEIPGIDLATILLILRLKKNLPVIPITASMEPTLIRLGIVPAGASREQKGRSLGQAIREEVGLSFHHFFLDHCQEICPPDEAQVQCKKCVLKRSCDFFQRIYKRMQAPQKSTAAKRRR